MPRKVACTLSDQSIFHHAILLHYHNMHSSHSYMHAIPSCNFKSQVAAKIQGYRVIRGIYINSSKTRKGEVYTSESIVVRRHQKKKKKKKAKPLNHTCAIHFPSSTQTGSGSSPNQQATMIPHHRLKKKKTG